MEGILPPESHSEALEAEATVINYLREQRAIELAASGMILVTWTNAIESLPEERRSLYEERFTEIKFDAYVDDEVVGIRFGIDEEPLPPEGLPYVNEPILAYKPEGRVYSRPEYAEFGDLLLDVVEAMKKEEGAVTWYARQVDDSALRDVYGLNDEEITRLRKLKSQSNNYVHKYRTK